MPKGYSLRNQGGWSHKQSSIDKMIKNRTGLTANEKNPRWMGTSVSYQALHNWVRRHFEKTINCENCKKNPGVNKLGYTKIQWANLSGKYLRERSDWMCLCVSCHKIYDLKKYGK